MSKVAQQAAVRGDQALKIKNIKIYTENSLGTRCRRYWSVAHDEENKVAIFNEKIKEVGKKRGEDRINDERKKKGQIHPMVTSFMVASLRIQ